MFTWLENHMLPCMYKQLLGVDCPMCGIQRSLLAALQGNFATSFSLYPPLLPVLVLIMLTIVWLISRRTVSKKFLVPYAWIVLALVMVNYSVKLIGMAHPH